MIQQVHPRKPTQETMTMTSSSRTSCVVSGAEPSCNSLAHKSQTRALDLMPATLCATAALFGGVNCPASLSCGPS